MDIESRKEVIAAFQDMLRQARLGAVDRGDTARKTHTVAEAAELLGISRGTAYEAVRMGVLPSVRLGRRILIPRHALDEFLTMAVGR